MKRDENRIYRKIPESAKEYNEMRGYDEGFMDGYSQAMYDMQSEEMQEIVRKQLMKLEERGGKYGI